MFCFFFFVFNLFFVFLVYFFIYHECSTPFHSKSIFCLHYSTGHTKSWSAILLSFFLFFWQTLTNAKHTPVNVTQMLFVTTHTDLTFAHANLDILKMDTIVQVQSIFCLHCSTGHTKSWSAILLSFFLFFFFLTNIDECKTYPGKCQVNATCNNTHQMQTWIYWRWTQIFLFLVVVFCFNTVDSQNLIFVK